MESAPLHPASPRSPSRTVRPTCTKPVRKGAAGYCVDARRAPRECRARSERACRRPADLILIGISTRMGMLRELRSVLASQAGRRAQKGARRLVAERA